MHKDDVKNIKLEDINPFDSSHIDFHEGFLIHPFDTSQTAIHRATIDLMKLTVALGKKIRPILVKELDDGKYQRLDGFSRYWTYKELGRKTIPCILGDTPGGQGGLSPFLKSDEC